MQFIDFLKKNKFSVHLSDVQETILRLLRSPLFIDTVEPFFSQIQPVGVPFLVIAEEPSSIIQIKHGINALYEIKEVLSQIEADQLLYKINSLKTRLHRACLRLMSLDFRVKQLFAKDLLVLAPLLASASSSVLEYTKDSSVTLSNMDSYKVGRKCGIAVDQLHPIGGQVDYEYLTTLSGCLPPWIKLFKDYIKKFSSTVSSYEPHIDKVQLDTLQDHALQLLAALDRTRETDIFLPLEALYYARVIRHTIVISQSILKEVGQLNETTQNELRAELTKIKYDLLPKFFGFIDKIETYSMLKPGVLSEPLMTEVSTFYSTLIAYSAKYINFDNADHLRGLEDGRFIEERLSQTHQRNTEERCALLELDLARKSANSFFGLLRDQLKIYLENKRFYQSPTALDIAGFTTELKTQLIKHYKIIHPYLLELNIPLNNVLGDPAFDGLNHAMFASLAKGIQGGFGGVVTQILLLKPVLYRYFEQLKNTHLFQIQTNDSLIDHVLESDHYLNPLSENFANPSIINETRLMLVVDNQKLLNEKKPLSDEQMALVATNTARIKELEGADDRGLDVSNLCKDNVLVLYDVYQKKQELLKRALKAYEAFHAKLADANAPEFLHSFGREDKKALNKLYRIFQSYVVNQAIPFPMDKSIVGILSKNQETVLAIDDILALHDRIFEPCFSPERLKLQTRHHDLSQRLAELFKQEQVLKPIVQEDRALYVIKHQKCSAAIVDLKKGLEKLIDMGNGRIKATSRRRKANGLPFPEITHVFHALAESSQTRTLKQLYNCHYHLEQLTHHFERLRWDMYSVTFYKEIYDLWPHLYSVYTIMQSLKRTESLSVVSQELTEKMATVYAMLNNLRRHYMPGEIDHSQGHFQFLFYTLSAVEIIPEHIKSIRVNSPLSSEKINEMQAHSSQISTDIEKIFANADSYLRLFLKIPTMNRLFNDLKRNLSKMSVEAHDVVVDNLAEIKHSLFANLLIDADLWEMRLGVEPGIFTSPIKTRLDAFYQGFVEPLGLESHEHLRLLVSEQPILTRMAAMTVEKTQQETDRDLALINKRRFSQLLVSIREYKPAVLATKEKMLRLFRPLIATIRDDLGFLAAELPAASAVAKTTDPLLNEAVGVDSALVNIEGLVNAAIHYYQGVRASHQFRIDAATKKINFLSELRVEQLELNRKYTKKYTEDCFDKQFRAQTTKPIGFIHCDDEYTEKLNVYLNSKKEDIVTAANNPVNVKQRVEKLLGDEVKKFETDYYRDFTHLESILTAIARLQAYLSHRDIEIESDHKHQCKKDLAKELKRMALDSEKPISERLSNLKVKIESSRFLLHDSISHVTWSMVALKHWFLWFLDLIGLYVPERKKCYNQLLNAATKPPLLPAGTLAAQHGIFAPPPRIREYELPELGPQPALPVPV